MKILYALWHGNGDAAMATAPFKAYKEKYPDREVGVATLRNRGNVPVDLLFPFVDEVAPILSEPWDWPEKYGKTLEEGRAAVYAEAIRYSNEHGYDKVVEITMNQLLSIHKGVRIAMEIGTYPLNDYKPIVNIPDDAADFGKMYVEGMKRPIIFIHGVAGNTPKSLPPEKIQSIVDKVLQDYGTVIECDSNVDDRSVKYKPQSIMKTAAIMTHVDRVVCIDSIVMHLAYALNVDAEALFTMTPPEQVFFERPPRNIAIVGAL